MGDFVQEMTRLIAKQSLPDAVVHYNVSSSCPAAVILHSHPAICLCSDTGLVSLLHLYVPTVSQGLSVTYLAPCRSQTLDARQTLDGLA